MQINTTMSDYDCMSAHPLVHENCLTIIISFLFSRQPWEAFAVVRAETIEVTPRRYKSVTFPNPIGISIPLQLQAVLLAHLSDLA